MFTNYDVEGCTPETADWRLVPDVNEVKIKPLQSCQISKLSDGNISTSVSTSNSDDGTPRSYINNSVSTQQDDTCNDKEPLLLNTDNKNKSYSVRKLSKSKLKSPDVTPSSRETQNDSELCSPLPSDSHPEGMDASRQYALRYASNSPPLDIRSWKNGMPYGEVIGSLQFGSQHVLDVESESLNFHLPDNFLRKTHYDRYLMGRWPFYKSAMYVVVAVMIGLMTALTGFFVLISIKILADVKYELFSYVMNMIHGEVISAEWSHYLYASAIVLMVNPFIVLIAAYCGHISPVSTGSGIPHIKAFLNGVKVKEVLHSKTYACKVIGVIFSVVGGMPVGKEGPMIHSGAVIGGGLSQGQSSTFSIFSETSIFSYFRNDRDKSLFVSCGTAAGVAAAFGAPLGGVLFNLEEGASYLDLPMLALSLVSSVVCDFLLQILKACAEGKCSDFGGESGLFSFGTFESSDWGFFQMMMFICMGIFGGLSGALFNYFNTVITKFRMVFRPRHKYFPILETLFVSAVVAIVALISIFMFDDCIPLSEPKDFSKTRPHIKMYCDEGYFHASAAIWFQTPEEAIKDLFHRPENIFSQYLLMEFAVSYFLLAFVTYGLRISSGIFIPSLLIGACWGRIVGEFITNTFTDQYWGGVGKFALMGAIAQLAGTVRIVICLCVIVVEASGNIQYLFPMLIVALIASKVGEIFNEGLYDIHNDMSGVPFLPWFPPVHSYKMIARDCMSRRVFCLGIKPTLREVQDAVKYTPFNCFPVVSFENVNAGHPGCRKVWGKLEGVVYRCDLLMMLNLNVVDENPFNVECNWERFNSLYPRMIDVRMIEYIYHYARSVHIDLSKILDRGCHKVHVSTAFDKCFSLIRYDRARHLIVVDTDNDVVGIITRKDILRFINLSSPFHLHGMKSRTMVLRNTRLSVDKTEQLGEFDRNVPHQDPPSQVLSTIIVNSFEVSKCSWFVVEQTPLFLSLSQLSAYEEYRDVEIEKLHSILQSYPAELEDAHKNWTRKKEILKNLSREEDGTPHVVLEEAKMKSQEALEAYDTLVERVSVMIVDLRNLIDIRDADLKRNEGVVHFDPIPQMRRELEELKQQDEAKEKGEKEGCSVVKDEGKVDEDTIAVPVPSVVVSKVEFADIVEKDVNT